MRGKPGGSPPTPPEVVARILHDYYDKKLGGNSVAKLHGVDKATVYNILTKHGKGMRPRSNRNGNEYGKAPGLVAKNTPSVLWRGGQRGVRLPVNEAAFDVRTPEMDYWLGFVMADGCISKESDGRSHRFMINLSAKDRGHLEALRRWLGSEHAIVDGQHLDPAGKLQYSCALAIASQPLCDALARYGITERKTTNEDVPPGMIDNRHFWRGCLDGDGSIYNHPAKAYLSGGKRIVEKWLAWARSRFDAQTRLYQHFGTPGGVGCWVGWVTGEGAFNLLMHLYQPQDVCLARKGSKVWIEALARNNKTRA